MVEFIVGSDNINPSNIRPKGPEVSLPEANLN